MKSMRILMPGCLFVFLLLFCTACGKEETPAEPEIRPVRYETIRYQNLSDTRTFTGQAKASTEIRLGFRIAGQIVALPVKLGDRLKKGDLVARLDDADDRLSLSELKAGMENARVQQEAALASLERIRALYAKNNVSLSEYETAKSKHAASVADYDTARQRVALQKSKLGYAVLRSPGDGYVALVETEVNENVQAGQTVISLTTGDDITVNIGLPEAYIDQVKNGDAVSISFSAIPGTVFEGTVYEVSYVAGDLSTYPVNIRIANPDSHIRPGMPAEVTFHLSGDAQRERIFVPVPAVVEDPDGRFVWLVKKGTEKGLGIVERRKVTVGTLAAKGFEVTEGLSENDVIVTAGVSKLTDGMTVRFLK